METAQPPPMGVGGAAEGRGLGVTPEHPGPSLGAVQYGRTPGTATEAPHPGLAIFQCPRIKCPLLAIR